MMKNSLLKILVTLGLVVFFFFVFRLPKEIRQPI